MKPKAELSKSLQKVLIKLEDLGVEYELTNPWKETDPIRIAKVKIPQDPAYVLEMMNMEGKALGVCCSDISAMRDIIFDAYREGGYMSVNDIHNFSDLSVTHDHFKATTIEKDWSNGILRYFHVWQLIKDHADDRYSNWQGKFSATDINDAGEALEFISNMATWMRMNISVSNPPPPGEVGHAAMMIDFYMMSVCMRKYLEHMHQIADKLKLPPKLEAWGVFSKKTGELFTSRAGALVVPDEQTLKNIIKNSDPEIKKDAVIKKVEIYLDKDLVIEEKK